MLVRSSSGDADDRTRRGSITNVMDVDVKSFDGPDCDLIAFEDRHAVDRRVFAEADDVLLAIAEAGAEREITEQGKHRRRRRHARECLAELNRVAEEQRTGPARTVRDFHLR